jgi:hypothetical protein
METLPSEAKEGKGLFGLFGKKDKEEATDDWSRNTEIYAPRSVLSSKVKTVTFPYDKDILCRVEYSDVSKLPEGTDPLLAVYNITGIAKFAKETSSSPKVHLSFALDSDGIVSLTRAEVSAEPPADAIAPGMHEQ